MILYTQECDSRRNKRARYHSFRPLLLHRFPEWRPKEAVPQHFLEEQRWLQNLLGMTGVSKRHVENCPQGPHARTHLQVHLHSENVSMHFSCPGSSTCRLSITSRICLCSALILVGSDVCVEQRQGWIFNKVVQHSVDNESSNINVVAANLMHVCITTECHTSISWSCYQSVAQAARVQVLVLSHHSAPSIKQDYNQLSAGWCTETASARVVHVNHEVIARVSTLAPLTFL